MASILVLDQVRNKTNQAVSNWVYPFTHLAACHVQKRFAKMSEAICMILVSVVYSATDQKGVWCSPLTVTHSESDHRQNPA